MNKDSIDAYEKNALNFREYRDTSKIGIQVASRWAQALDPDAKVIEIACGAGVPVTQTLVDAGLKMWAIDSSPTLISAFKERFPDIPAQCATVQESDYFQEKFDAAICIGLIFLLCEKDQIKMLGRISEILRPGASFLFTAPIEVGTWKDLSTGHECISLGREVYESTIEQSGFCVVGCHEDSGKNNYYEVEKVFKSVSINAA